MPQFLLALMMLASSAVPRGYVGHTIARGPILEGYATWYGNEYLGRPMRNGDTYTGNDMTCALSADLYPFFAGRTLRVCAPWRCIEVVVTDSGDTEAFEDHHVAVDLSMRAFQELAALDVGILPVEVWLR